MDNLSTHYDVLKRFKDRFTPAMKNQDFGRELLATVEFCMSLIVRDRITKENSTTQLSDDATDHLLRVSEGRPSAQEEADMEGINVLANLTRNVKVGNEEMPDAANYLAELTRNEERR